MNGILKSEVRTGMRLLFRMIPVIAENNQAGGVSWFIIH